MSNIKKLKINSEPYFIAEIGFNHLGNYNLACKMVIEAKKAGADAVKFQTYKPEEMVLRNTKHYKILQNTELTLIEYIKIKNLCKKLKIDLITTPFDLTSVKLCKKIGFDAIKIASMDLNNNILISEISKLDKPIIISTGMSSMVEIKNSIKLIKNKKNFFILHCVSNYPTTDDKSDLFFLKKIKKKYNWKIGFSDHTLNDYSAIAAIMLGAKIIEKHFTSNRNIKGADNQMSYNTMLLKNLIIKSKELHYSLINKKKRSDEKNKNKMRRYIFLSKNVKKKHKITVDDILMLRCNKFNKKLIPVNLINKVIGKKLTSDFKKNQPLALANLE